MSKTFKQFANTHTAEMLSDLFNTGICRPVVSNGSGRRTSYKDYTDEVLKFLNREAVELGNDAPRGGAVGKFIKLKF